MMMEKYPVTVCLCVYNAEKYIVETLESLKKQTFKAFQILILDDGSTDQTRQVVKKYFEENSWTEPEIINFPENHGTAWIRNYALNHVTTPLMMFFDADDIAKPEFIEKLYNSISADDSLIAVSSYCNYMDAKGKVLNGGIYLGPTTKDAFMVKAANGKQMFIANAAIFRREYAIKAGGYRQAEWFPKRKDGIRYEDMSEDVDLWGRMSDFYQEGKYIIVLPELLFFYRKNTNSLSTGFTKARVMGQKLIYIKTNLKRRRAGLPELKFQEFWENLSLWRKWNFERRNLGAYFYRKACFAWVKRNLFACGGDLMLGALCTPLYPLEKYKANFRKKSK